MALPRRALIPDDDANEIFEYTEESLPPLEGEPNRIPPTQDKAIPYEEESHRVQEGSLDEVEKESLGEGFNDIYREPKHAKQSDNPVMEHIESVTTDNTPPEKESTWDFDPKVFFGSMAAIILVIGSLIYAIYHFGLADKTIQELPKPSPTAATVDKGSEKSTGNPILDQYPDAPKVSDSGKVTISIAKDKKSIATDSGRKLTIDKSSFVLNNKPCTVTKSTDFCLVGSTTSDNVLYNVYFFKDAAHSMLFQDVSNFTKATVKGSPSAGILPVATNNQKNAALAVVNKDSSGWVILSNTGDTKKVAKVAPKVTVQ